MDYDRKQAWLAIRYGCCASKEDGVDHGREALRANGESEMQICYDQPQSIPQDPMHYTPRPSTTMSRHVSQWVSSSKEFATRASSRASISTLARPNFAALTRPRRSHSRPSIGCPTDFRHYEGVDGVQSMVDHDPMPVRRRRSFRPLELSIYLPDGCGHLSPLPDFDDEDLWGRSNANLTRPPEALVRVRDSRTSSLSSNPDASKYLIQRKPVGTGSRRSSTGSEKSNSSKERRLSGTTMGTFGTPAMGSGTEDNKSCVSSFTMEHPSIARPLTSESLFSPSRILSRLPSPTPTRSRASTTPSRPGSVRRARTGTDVDEAIRELNTIVEERRASAYRSQNLTASVLSGQPPLSPCHVPSIAPSMRMRVRSETLNDIGSAFSSPLPRKVVPAPFKPISEASSPGTGYPPAGRKNSSTSSTPSRPTRTRTYSGPLTSNPITPPAPHTPTTPVGRLGAWLKKSAPSSPTALSFFKSSRPTTPKKADADVAPVPFYQCAPLALRGSSASDDQAIRAHARQESKDSTTTATVTLYSSSEPSTRATSPAESTYPQKSSPALNLSTLNLPSLAGIAKSTASPTTTLHSKSSNPTMNTRKKRVPAPLLLVSTTTTPYNKDESDAHIDTATDDEKMIEAALCSARSTTSFNSVATLRAAYNAKPPQSPNAHILRGMERVARESWVGVPSPGAVGVAF